MNEIVLPSFGPFGIVARIDTLHVLEERVRRGQLSRLYVDGAAGVTVYMDAETNFYAAIEAS